MKMDNPNRVIFFYFIHFETGPYYEGLTDLELTNANQAGLKLTGSICLCFLSVGWTECFKENAQMSNERK